jgi:hypothetical protein
MGLVLMSQRELSRIEVLGRLIDGRVDATVAGRLMGLSRRQVCRLKKRFVKDGAVGISHKSRGRVSNRKTSDQVRVASVALVSEHYADFGPTLAAEKLLERHGIKVSRETLRHWMVDAGLWQTRATRKRIYQPRHRRQHRGELVQIDGSEHDWFEGRRAMCTLLVFIDDATSQLMALRFAESENTFSYFGALEDYLHRHGRPVAFYSDKYSVFRVTGSESRGGRMTQFGRALSQLNIDIICANSSQAKGRVERANKTLQDRLIKELRLAGIDDIETANAWLPGFMEDFNQRFAKPPASHEDLHRDISDIGRLEDILCWREERYVSQQLVVHYNQLKLSLIPEGVALKLGGKPVEVYDFPDGRLQIRYQGHPLPYKIFDKLQRVTQAAIVDNKRLSEVLTWIKAEQEKRELTIPHTKTPHRKDQKPGMMKARMTQFEAWKATKSDKKRGRPRKSVAPPLQSM